MFCESCGARIPDDAKFCEECGTSASLAGQGMKVQSTYPGMTMQPGKTDNGMQKGLIIGIAVGVVILLILVVVILFRNDGTAEEDKESSAQENQTVEESDYLGAYEAETKEDFQGYAKEYVPVQQNPGSTNFYEVCQVVHCREYITLRDVPLTSGNALCKIPLGADVYYIENAKNGFVKIEYQGQTGYVLASYLNFTKEEGSIFMRVYNCQESITLRKIPDTKGEAFCQIPLGAWVVFRETAENGFYMISYNGYTGYALAEYLTE